MIEQKNGGPAFPILQECEGMSLRDYFAAKALQGLIAGVIGGDRKISTTDDKPVTEEALVQQAYFFADAMLAERAK